MDEDGGDDYEGSDEEDGRDDEDEEERSVDGVIRGASSVVDITLVLNFNVKVVLCQCGKAFKVPGDAAAGSGGGGRGGEDSGWGSEAEEERRLVPAKEGKELRVNLDEDEEGDGKDS